MSVQFTNPQSFSDSVWHLCDVLQELFCCFVGSNVYVFPYCNFLAQDFKLDLTLLRQLGM